MGMYDTVYVSSDVAAVWSFRCTKCHRTPKPDVHWQTKALDPCMHSYFLRHDEGGAIRLYPLDRPSDRRFGVRSRRKKLRKASALRQNTKDGSPRGKRSPAKVTFCPRHSCPNIGVSVSWESCRTSGWKSITLANAASSWSTGSSSLMASQSNAANCFDFYR